MSVIVSVHKKDGRTVVAVCDKDLLGNVFEEGKKQLDLSGDFYRGDELDYQEAGDLVRNADIINLVGKESVDIGLDEAVIEPENIITIDGIPSAQAILMQD